MTKPAGGDTSCRVVCQVPSGHEVKARAGSPVENVTVAAPEAPRNGADLMTVRELLGHSSVSVTMPYPHTNRRESPERV